MTSLGAAFALLLAARTASAQLTAGLDFSVPSDFLWRGLTRVNRMSLQPSAFLGVKGPTTVLTAGAWADLEPFKPDPADFSSVGSGQSGLGEADFWLQWDWRYMRASTKLDVSLGGTVYTFHGDSSLGGRGSEWNTTELYAKARLSDIGPILTILHLPRDLPLAVDISTWVDLGPIHGVYGEVGLEADLPILPLGEPLSSLIVRAASGVSFWQVMRPGTERGYYDGNGPTHLDLSAGTVLFFPLGSAGVTVYPVGHLQVGFDGATLRRSLTTGDRTRVFGWWQLTVSLLSPLRRTP